MWNDEKPEEQKCELRSIASSWALLGIILAASVGWSSLWALVDVAVPMLQGDRVAEPREKPLILDALEPADETAAHCRAPDRGEPDGSDSRRQRRLPADDASSLTISRVLRCDSGSLDAIGLPGAGLSVDWESLR